MARDGEVFGGVRVRFRFRRQLHLETRNRRLLRGPLMKFDADYPQ